MGRTHINIGSNLGNSRSALERAVAEIDLLSGDGSCRRSSVVESEPWGFSSPHKFLNIGVEIVTELAPDELMSRLLAVQNSICSASHRTTTGAYADREVDIDLVYYDDVVMPQMWSESRGEVLTVPHPRMHLREFMLRPVMELSPQWVHPVFGMTAGQLLERLSGNLG
jgi:2-amino-4-hydroxy-6-hydroxymethyldihydropteridine diphosphokinase